MRHIVNDLLVLAKLEGDNKPPSDQMIDMRAVLRHLQDDAASLSSDHHKITFRCRRRLTVTGVETEILSALGNLVTNAIRYTPDGGAIRVNWHAQGGQRGVLRHATADSAFRRGYSTADRALLSRRSQPFARYGRHGAGSCHRQACAATARCATRREERRGAWQHVHRALSRCIARRAVNRRRFENHRFVKKPPDTRLAFFTQRFRGAHRLHQEQNFVSSLICALRDDLPGRRRR